MMKIFKHIFWFISGLASVVITILLFSTINTEHFPKSLILIESTSLLPFIIPGLIAIFVWKKSWAFAAGVGIWVLYLLINLCCR